MDNCQLSANGVDEMAEKVAEGGVPLGSNTTGCSVSLAGNGGNFEKTRACSNRRGRWQTCRGAQ
eukprot:5214078-Pleurochrysis_carterae.AAC.1